MSGRFAGIASRHPIDQAVFMMCFGGLVLLLFSYVGKDNRQA